MGTQPLRLFALSALALLLTHFDVEAADVDEELELEEVIVTASRREQRLIDVPMAIATMSGIELKQRGIDTVQELSFAVPGLTMREDGPGSYQIFLRGVANAYGGGALTSIYQDEIPMNFTGFDVLPTRVMDVDRIEVLKGPQGTLYGQGAVGGAIIYLTKRPVMNTFEGSLEVDAWSVTEGDYGSSFTGIVNIPIVEDKFAIRLAANFRNGGGWQDQPEANIEDGNDEDLRNIRLKALWSPTERLDILGTYVSYNAEYELGLGYEQPDRTVWVATDPALRLIPKIWDYDLYNLEITYDFNAAELLSSTSYADMNHQYPFTYIGGPETIYGGALSGYSARFNPGDQFSQELRLASTGNGKFQWTVGGFYRDMERQLLIPEGVTEFSGVLYPFTYFITNTSESYSIFGDGSFQISDKWQLGAGVRYYDAKQTQHLVGADKQKGSFDSVDPRFYVSYSINENRNLYASVSKGFRSGGFNGGDQPDFDPEELWSYELGYKASILGGALYFDAAVYFTQYDDMLRRGLVFISVEQGFQSLTSNIGEAEIKGIEASLTWQATDALAINFSGSLIDAEVTKLEAEGTANIKGDPIDYVPDYSFTVGMVYDFNWSAEMPGYLRANYSYRDELPYVDRTSFPPENLPQFSDTIGLFDARLGLRRNNVYAEFYVQNLSDVNKYIDPYHGWNNANRTRPRAVGVLMGVEF